MQSCGKCIIFRMRNVAGITIDIIGYVKEKRAKYSGTEYIFLCLQITSVTHN